MTELLQNYTHAFRPISLDELNTRAALLDRKEHKYILSPEQLRQVTAALSDRFDVLTIDSQTVFNYQSVYMDTDDLVSYTYDNQGSKKRRFKARTRYYVESGLCYFEIKLKDKYGGTVKKRMRYATEHYGTVTEEAMALLKCAYTELYDKPFEYELRGRMEVKYSRMTLVAREGGERMTIDFNLSFSDGYNATAARQFIIVETKSSSGNGIADRLFRNLGIRPRSCSKFSLGMNLLSFKVRYNKYKPLLKLYNTLPFVDPNMQAYALPSVTNTHVPIGQTPEP